MADLGNSKIKDTYQLVLQTDASGNLQKLDGTTPSPFIVNGNLRYVDGNQALNYVLTSDASGNASWSEAGGTSYWSANTDGTISPSGLTTSVGIGTTTPNKPLTVVGDISGTTDLYLGSSTHTASTITAEETLTIKGNGLNDYLYLANDRIQMYMDGGQIIDITPTSLAFNASSTAVDFSVLSEDSTSLIRTRAEHNIVRLLKHVSINSPTGWVQVDEQRQALVVSGTSVFYSGGTSHNTEAIVALGNISGTTNLYIDDNMYSGTTNLLDIFASSAITNQDVYWSANTDGSISPSGLTTTVQTEGDLTVSGTIRTTNITTTGGTTADTLTIEAGEIHIRNEEGLTEYLHIGVQGFSFYLNDTVAIQFSPTAQKYSFDGRPGSGTDWYSFHFAGDNGYDVMLLDPQWEVSRFRKHVAISDTYATWSNAKAITYGLYVSGSSIFYSGGTSLANTNAIEASGNISGTTNLYIDENMYSGTTNLLDIFNSSATLPYTVDWSANTGTNNTGISPSGTSTDVRISGDTYIAGTGILQGNLGVSGNTYLPDNGKVIFGDASDLKIYHSGSHSIIQDTGAGDLHIKGSITKIRGTSVSEDCGVFTENGSVELYYNGIKTFETTSYGVSGDTLVANGNLGVSGITTSTGGFVGDVNGNRKFELSTANAGNGEGDIVYFPVGDDSTSTTPGAVYYFNGTQWAATDANALVSSSGLTAVALGAYNTNGMLIRGMVTLAASPGGVDGNAIYLSETAGKAVSSPPTSASAVVRTIGYVLDVSDKKIWFNPDNTWVELKS